MGPAQSTSNLPQTWTKKSVTWTLSPSGPVSTYSLFQHIYLEKIKASGCTCTVPGEHHGTKINDLLFKNERVCVFCCRSPASSCHLLVVPNNDNGVFYKDCRDLISNKGKGLELLDEMVSIAKRLVLYDQDQENKEERRRINDHNLIPLLTKDNLFMGFHHPPHNSIDHLHLHVLNYRDRSWLGRLKFGLFPSFKTVESVRKECLEARGVESGEKEKERV